jgi:hypothetical protein
MRKIAQLLENQPIEKFQGYIEESVGVRSCILIGSGKD